jgi:hypothetical protein
MPTRDELILQFMLALAASVKASPRWHEPIIIAHDATMLADAYLDQIR